MTARKKKAWGACTVETPGGAPKEETERLTSVRKKIDTRGFKMTKAKLLFFKSKEKRALQVNQVQKKKTG